MVLYVVMYCVRVVRLYIENIVQHDKDFRRELKKNISRIFFYNDQFEFPSQGENFFCSRKNMNDNNECIYQWFCILSCESFDVFV